MDLTQSETVRKMVAPRVTHYEQTLDTNLADMALSEKHAGLKRVLAGRLASLDETLARLPVDARQCVLNRFYREICIRAVEATQTALVLEEYHKFANEG